MKVLVFNGWAAGPEVWALCEFPHDWVFDYVEQLDGLPEKVMEERRDQGSGIRDQVLWKGMSERRLAALHLGTQMMFKDDPSPMYREDNMQRGLDYLRNTDLRDSLMSFRRGRGRSPSAPLPVRIFQSERDGIVRATNVAFLQQVFPQAKMTMVPGNEHVLPVAVPELIDEAVFEIMGTYSGKSKRLARS